MQNLPIFLSLIAWSSCAALAERAHVEGTPPIGGTRTGGSETPDDLDTSSIPKVRKPVLLHLGYRATFEDVKAISPASSDEVSDNVIPLTMTMGICPGQKYRRLLERSREEQNETIGTALVKSVQDETFITTLKVGDQEFQASLDLGSSDTFLAMTGFECMKQLIPEGPSVDGLVGTFLGWLAKLASQPKPKCRLGPTYNKTSTFSQIPDQHFNISFTDGAFARGIMAKETVTLGNITIADQPMGFANELAWPGDGMSSGQIGLAFPSITNAYAGTDFSKDKKGANILYPPIFTNMYRQKLIKPYFSMALNRASEGPGVLVLGGLPGPSIRHTGNFVRVPMQKLTIRANRPVLKSEDGVADYMFYAANIDGLTVNSARVSGPMQVIIDSGSRFSHLPWAVVEAFEEQWKRDGAELDQFTKQLRVPCTRTPPRLGVVFNGTAIYFDSKDLILRVADTKYCVSTVAKGIKGDDLASGQWLLGASFLRSVLAVFDVGAGEMRFANRVR